MRLARPWLGLAVVALVAAGAGAWFGIRGALGGAATAASAVPAARTDAALAYDPADRQLLMYGGQGVVNGHVVELGDTWTWDGSSWTERHLTTHPAGEAVGLGYDAVGRQLVLLTAAGAGGTREQTWLWDGSAWRKAAGASPPQSLGAGSAVATDPVSGRVLLVVNPTIVPMLGRPCLVVPPNDKVLACPPIPGPRPSTWEWTGRGWRDLGVLPPQATAVPGQSFLAMDPQQDALEYITVGAGVVPPCPAIVPPPGPAQPPRPTGSLPQEGLPPSAAAGDATGCPLPGAPAEHGDVPPRSITLSPWNGTAWSAPRRISMASTGQFTVGAAFADTALGAMVLFNQEDGSLWELTGSRWTEMASGGPAGMSGAALAYDAASAQVALFGGMPNAPLPCCEVRYSSQTWTWQNDRWAQHGGMLVRARFPEPPVVSATAGVVTPARVVHPQISTPQGAPGSAG